MPRGALSHDASDRSVRMTSGLRSLVSRSRRARTPLAVPSWAGVVLIGLTIMLGEHALARLGLWAAMQADTGTPCGQVLCSCPSTRLARLAATMPCGGTQGGGYACVRCGHDTVARVVKDQPMLVRSIDSDQPGLLLMASVAPLVLVVGRPKATAPPADRGVREKPASHALPRSRTLGVEPQPPRHA